MRTDCSCQQDSHSHLQNIRREHELIYQRVLTRIYYGTLRLGIDLSKLRAQDVRLVEDTVVVKLPPVGLLDDNFIDETRTKTFFSKGSWEPSDREALYARARKQMLARCLTEENIHIAQANAIDEVTNLFQSMGFMYVKIHF